ncbi:MAG: tetratricopeptide repeat protein [Candidatus Eisenbacteria bacterium]|uniref:Tetratricopeptide repeat protein n=1 Tax=Eiseniibacteriota bacterium TaxID=2212470 RepID=A0A538T8S9_UNCEI|nr:MAG: tetratricopeptide repeat protein [Candidatus Eisenbacteria bacterium]
MRWRRCSVRFRRRSGSPAPPVAPRPTSSGPAAPSATRSRSRAPSPRRHEGPSGMRDRFGTRERSGRHARFVRLASAAALLLAAICSPPPAPAHSRAPAHERFRKPAPVRAEPRVTLQERHLAEARKAFDRGRVEEARALLKGIDPAQLPRGLGDDASFLTASLSEDAATYDRLLDEYLKNYPRGAHRRAVTLALGRSQFAQGDYREAENLLSIFSPGVESDPLGREGLIWRGLSQLGRGDAPGAYQFFFSAKPDLDGSTFEESYYFAMAGAALRAGKPREAVDALKVILARHSRGDYAPQALYAMGVSLETMGRAADAAAVFRQVAQRFPESYEATRARDRGIRTAAGTPTLGLPIGGGYSIQVGAFSRRELAEALAKDLRLSGVGDVQVLEGRETTPIYRVRAGAFATRDEARALGERLRRERGFSYNIVPR